MPLIDYADTDKLDEKTRQMLSRAELPDGTIPAFARMMANNPEVFGVAMGQFSTVMFGGSVDVGLKQLAFVTVSQVNDSPYCAATHGQQLVEALGYPMANLEALAAGDDSAFTEEQRAVVEFARQAATDPHEVSDKHITALREAGFDKAGIVELLAAVAQASFANTIVETIEIVPADENPDLTRYYPKSA